MIQGENFEGNFREALKEADHIGYYIQSNAVPWIVGFYDSDENDGAGDPFVFGTLVKDNASKTWGWTMSSPGDFETFLSYAREVELGDEFRNTIQQFKDARSRDFEFDGLGLS